MSSAIPRNSGGENKKLRPRAELRRAGRTKRFFEALVECLRPSPHLPSSPALGAWRQYSLSSPPVGLIGSKSEFSVPPAEKQSMYQTIQTQERNAPPSDAFTHVTQ